MAECLAGLGRQLRELERAQGLAGNQLFYLATDPKFFVPLIARLVGHGLTRAGDDWCARAVIEKPFGLDLLELDRRLLEPPVRRSRANHALKPVGMEGPPGCHHLADETGLALPP